MKFLINDNFKAIRRGAFVEANADNGEFIFNTDSHDDLTVATMKEIGASHGIKIPSKAKREEVVALLSEKLSNIKIAEVNKMTDTQTVEKIIEEGVANGKSDDEMLVEIVNAGVSFKNAGKLFKSVMESNGLRITTKERMAKANEIMEAADFTPTTVDNVKGMVKKLCDDIADTNEKAAMAAIRKYAKANDITLPKVSRGKGAPGGGIQSKIQEWLLANRDADKDAIGEQIKTIKDGIGDAQLKKHVDLAFTTLEFARKFAA